MAAGSEAGSSQTKLNLRASKDELERGGSFWNVSVVEIKFSTGKDWLKAVRRAEGKPNYGMLNMDGLLEEVVGNKLELAGPMIDGYLLELGKSMKSMLTRSKRTGLVNPVSLFIPWMVFRHVLTLVRGYSGDVYTKHDGSKHAVTLTRMDSIRKLFSFFWRNALCLQGFQEDSFNVWRENAVCL